MSDNELLAESLRSLFFSISIKKFSKYEAYKADENNLFFHDTNDNIIKISLGKLLLKECIKENVELMLIHSLDILKEELPEDFTFHFWAKGVKELSKKEKLEDVLDGVFISFKTEEDYEKFINIVYRSTNE